MRVSLLEVARGERTNRARIKGGDTRPKRAPVSSIAVVSTVPDSSERLTTRTKPKGGVFDAATRKGIVTNAGATRKRAAATLGALIRQRSGVPMTPHDDVPRAKKSPTVGMRAYIRARIVAPG